MRARTLDFAESTDAVDYLTEHGFYRFAGRTFQHRYSGKTAHLTHSGQGATVTII